MKVKFTKQERSWILYDWANSVFATVMMAAIFPVFFTSIAEGAGVSGDMWWGIGASIATFLVAVCSPFLGAIGDYHGMKKRLLTIFLVIGLSFTLFCALVSQWQWLLVGYIFSQIGFSGSCLFYDSMLTDITTPERMDRVSSWGYAMGYIGGSTIPFLLSISLMMFGGAFGIDTTMAVRFSLVITVVWWSLFSIPLLKNCNQLYGKDIPAAQLMKTTLHSLGKSLKHMVKTKGILLFLLAYFFYIDGVHTVIRMSTAYGTALGLDSTGMIIALLVTQIVAFPCAIWFGKLSSKVGTIRMLLFSVGLYVVICLIGFVMGFGLEEAFLTQLQALTLFWILAVLVGTVQGGIQALSRSFFGKIIPREHSNEYFGVYDIFGKFSAVLGPALYAFVTGVTGRSSFAILSIVLLFFVGGIILLVGRKHIEAIEGAMSI